MVRQKIKESAHLKEELHRQEVKQFFLITIISYGVLTNMKYGCVIPKRNSRIQRDGLLDKPKFVGQRSVGKTL